MKIRNLFFFILFCFFSFSNSFVAMTDPLPSWNEGAVKNSILKFIEDLTTEGKETFVPEANRIATFDQDGTLWVEQPLYAQLFFALDRIKALAPLHPEWKTEEPFKFLLEGNLKEAFSNHAMEKIVAATHSGMPLQNYHEIVREWLKTARHPRFHKPFTSLVYQPMLEVLQLFKANGFKNYIVSGGGQEFIRVYAQEVYQIPPEQIIGTTEKVEYIYHEGKPVLIKKPEILFINDKEGKPETINLFIGQRPIAAFGNSTGDQQMLEWTHAGKNLHFEALVHHDDAEREYAYDKDSKIGTFSEALIDEAKTRRWNVISMKKDWKVIFPP